MEKSTFLSNKLLRKSPLLGFFLLLTQLSFGQVSVSATAGTMGPTNYATIQLAFAAVNAGTHQGVITLAITANTTETVAPSLNASGSGSANYTSLTISPSGGASRTITGALAAGTPIINFNGADNVTINGLNSGGNSLTISNTTVGNTSTIRLLNDASNNTITNCTVLGSGTTNSNGTIAFFTGTTTGNDNNTISNCNIAPAGSNLPANAIYSDGTSVTVSNDNITINNNTIQDYFSATTGSCGIYVNTDSSGWTITNNRLFQTGTRTTTTDNIVHRPIFVSVPNATSVFTINNNTIGYANSSGTGKSIYTGAATTFRGIELSATSSLINSVQGNVISGINFTTNRNNASAEGFFTGIFINSGTANLGTVEGNLIGSTTETNSIIIESTSVGDGRRFCGIYVNTTNASVTSTIQNNIISGLSTAGPLNVGYSIIAIHTTGSGIFNINNNTIGADMLPNAISAGTAGVTTTGRCDIYGIFNGSSGNTISINNNFIRNCNVNGIGAASFFIGIQSQATNTGGTITINNNLIEKISSIGTGAINPIWNSSSAATLNIENNTIRDINITVNTTALNAIQNNGAITSQVNIRNNKLGDNSNNFVTTTNNYISTIIGISNTGGTNTCALTITENDIRKINHVLLANNVHNYIQNTASTLSQNISNNTFTNLSVNMSGNVTFILNNASLPSGGSQTVSGNSIVTGFSKTAVGGILTLFNTNANSTAGTTITNSNNNFSNISVVGATTIDGWRQIDGGFTNKTIEFNTFSNWTGGTAAITAMNLNGFGGLSSVSNNTISTISVVNNIVGLTIGVAGNATTLNINSNIISNLTSTGTIAGNSNVTGLSSSNNSTIVNISNTTVNNLASSGIGTSAISGLLHGGGSGTTNIFNNTVSAITLNSASGGIIYGVRSTASINVSNVYKNKIYDLSATTSANPLIIGISFLLNANSNLNAYNNLITDLRAVNGSNGTTDVLQGISVTNNGGANSIANVSYNTIVLSGSGGANFTTAAVLHQDNTTATTGTLVLRNNIIINKCVPSGTGITIALRRTLTTFANYSTTSNNNLLYANIPNTNNIIFFDGTNRRQTIDSFRLAVTPRESNSEYENVSFLSTDPTSSDFLRPNVTAETFVESSGINIAGITDDYQTKTRFGNLGYIVDVPPGNAPDVGAYEINGIQPLGAVVISGALGGINGVYTTVSAAFTAINSVAQTAANISVKINLDINEGSNTATLNSGTWTSLNIVPKDNITVSGATTAGNSLIVFNGADNVTINGINTGGNSLTFENTTVSSTAGTSTIRFINDAISNLITNCIIKGAANMPLATEGGVVFFSTGTTTGNDSNTISNCNITASGSNLPSKLIYSSGSTGSSALANSLVTINNCNLFDNFLPTGSAAIYAITGNTNWSITNNRIYQSTTRTFTAAGTLHGIYFANPTFGVTNTITGNTIGYATNTQTGTFTINGSSFNGNFNGILFEGQNIGNTNNINSNIISDISFTSAAGAFNGIINATTTTVNTININSNTVRNITIVTTTGTATAINGGGSGTLTVSTNIINNITRNTAGILNGIFSNVATTTAINTNTITNLSSTDAAAPSTIYGIRQITSTGAKTFNSNIINNLSGTSGAFIYGISNESGNATSTISLNIINSLSSSGGTTPIVTGINKTATTTNNVFRNKIYDLSSTASNPNVSGVLSTGTGSTTNISNNIIGDLKAPSANASNPINGINIIGGTTVNVYYNSIYLTASGGVSNFGSSAIFCDTSVNVTFINNIFVNNSAIVGAGLAVAYRRSGTLLTSYQTTSNNNCFFSSTSTLFTDGTNTYSTLPSFQAGVGSPRESNSISYEPIFISTLASNASFLLFDFNDVNAVSNAGIFVSGFTIDFENEIRNLTTPDIGADEFTAEAEITSFTRGAILPAAALINFCVSGGQTISIQGKNLNVGGIPIVNFNGNPATVISNTPSLVVVTSPALSINSTITLQTTVNTATSTEYVVTPIAVGGTISGDQIICPNTKPSDITLTGSVGTIVWQRATNEIFTAGLATIVGQTSAVLSGAAVPNLTSQKNYIRAVLTSGSCAQTFSPTVIVTTATSWNGSTWSDGTPSSSIGAIVAGNGLVITSNFEACNMIVNTGVTVTVNTNGIVNLVNNLAVNGSGRINFANTTSLVQTNNTTPNTGNIYYNRLTSTIVNNFDFVYWGTPVNTQLLGRIWMSSASNDTFYRWDHTIPAWSFENLFTVMVPGRGYIARSRNGTTGIDSDGITSSPVFNTPATWLAKFKGIPVNGDISVAVGASNNLIANPYPSAIDIKTFKDDVSNSTLLDGNFYFWTHNTQITGNAYTNSDYAIYNSNLNAGTVAITGGLAPDRFVDACQSFFADGVLAGNITFKNSHRVAGNNNAFYRTNNQNSTQNDQEIPLESSKFWLNISSTNGLFKQQMLTYTEGASNGYDQQLDAKSFEGNPDIDFYSIIPNYKFTIQSRRLPFETADTVNLGYTTTVAGTFKIETDHFDGLFTTQEFFLRDNLTGIVHDIKNNPYTFTTSVGTFDNRFQIIYEYICAQNTTWDGERWSNGLPSLTKGAVIFNDFTATADMNFCTLEIIGAAVVTVPSGINFKVQHTVNVIETANLIFENNANLIQISNTNNKGNITTKRNVDLRRLEYTYWSSPVLQQNILNFSPQTLANRFYNYSETNNNFAVITSPDTNNFALGTGYSIRAPNNFSTSPTTFNGVFTGVPANGTMSYPATKNNQGYNLIGNPYPSTIDANLFLAENPSTLYFWSKATLGAPVGENYATYTNLGGTAAAAGGAIPNGTIQVGQGFFCQVPATRDIVFNNLMRTANNSNQFFRIAPPTGNINAANLVNETLAPSIEKHRIWLNLTSNTTSFNQIMVGYMTGATQGLDIAIDGKLYNNSQTSLYSLINNNAYTIQGRSLPFTNSDMIPLGFKTDLNSNFTIAIQDLDGLFSGTQNVFLKDNLTNTIHDLKQSAYNFNANAGVFNNRFQLVFVNGTLGTADLSTENSIAIVKIKKEVIVKSQFEKISKVLVFDLLGRKLIDQKAIKSNEVTINNISISEQTLIIKVVLENGGTVTRKLIY